MKNSNNKWLAIATIILLLVNIAMLTLLWINKGKENGANNIPQPQAQAFQYVTEQLQLTPQQQDEYKKLREEHQVLQRGMQDSIHNAKDAFFALLQQPNVSEEVLNVAAKKSSDVDEQMDLVTFKHFQKVRAICTAEQQKKFDGIIKDVLRRMAGPHPQGRPPQGFGKEGRDGELPPPPQN